MRLGALLVAIVWGMLGLIGSAVICPAGADEPRYVPAVGTMMTYRLMFTVNAGDREMVFGQIYRLTTTASDGTAVEGTLTPLALIRRCPDADTSKDCQQARNYPDISRDGDLITIPVPPEISAGLAKLSKFAARDFIRYTQSFPTPGAQDVEEVEKPRIGTAPLFIQTNTVECDDAVLRGFFPLGTAEQITVPCTVTAERSQSRLAVAPDAKNVETVTYELSFGGHEHIAVPAGDYPVAAVKLKSTPVSGSGPVVEGDWAFIENLGFSAKNTVSVHYPDSSNSTRVVRELIKVGP